jgi:hypothetical protein
MQLALVTSGPAWTHGVGRIEKPATRVVSAYPDLREWFQFHAAISIERKDPDRCILKKVLNESAIPSRLAPLGGHPSKFAAKGLIIDMGFELRPQPPYDAPHAAPDVHRLVR